MHCISHGLTKLSWLAEAAVACIGDVQVPPLECDLRLDIMNKSLATDFITVALPHIMSKRVSKCAS